MLQLLELRDFSKTCEVKESGTEAAFPRAWPAHVSTSQSKIEMAVLFEKNMCLCVSRGIQAQSSQCTWLLSRGVRISIGIYFLIPTFT